MLVGHQCISGTGSTDKVKNNKAESKDGIPSELLKALGESGRR